MERSRQSSARHRGLCNDRASAAVGENGRNSRQIADRDARSRLVLNPTSPVGSQHWRSSLSETKQRRGAVAAPLRNLVGGFASRRHARTEANRSDSVEPPSGEPTCRPLAPEGCGNSPVFGSAEAASKGECALVQLMDRSVRHRGALMSGDPARRSRSVRLTHPPSPRIEPSFSNRSRSGWRPRIPPSIFERIFCCARTPQVIPSPNRDRPMKRFHSPDNASMERPWCGRHQNTGFAFLIYYIRTPEY